MNINISARYVSVSLILAFGVTLGAAYAAPKGEQSGQTKDGVKLTKEALHVAKGELTDLVIKAKETLERFTRGETPAISQTELSTAQCVLVFPNVTRAAALIGGKHGDGLATCRGKDSEMWSKVGFVDLRGASFGAQLGVERSDVVMLLKNEKAAEQLREGRMRFAADVSYAFGSEVGGRKVSTDQPADVKIFTDTEGAFVTASLQGSYVAADDEELRKFYDQEVHTLYSALTTQPAKDARAEVRELLVLLPTEASASS